MKNLIRISLLTLIAAALLSTSVVRIGSAGTTGNLPAPQYGDPYSDFRNARYSNNGLLKEADELKLGAQLHREVTKKYNLTDAGLARVERLGQRWPRARMGSNLAYKFHVIQSREINGFSLPGGHIYITTGLI